MSLLPNICLSICKSKSITSDASPSVRFVPDLMTDDTKTGWVDPDKSNATEAYRRNRADLLATIARLEAEGDILQAEVSRLEQKYETNLKAISAMQHLVRNYDEAIARG